MGVDGFGVYLRRAAPHVFRKCTIRTLHGKRLAVDMPLFLVKFFKSTGNNDAATLGRVRDLCARMKEQEATPTFVFDGDTAAVKVRARAVRKRREDTLRERLLAEERRREAPDTPPDDVMDAAVKASKLSLALGMPSAELAAQVREVLAEAFGSAAVLTAPDDAERLIAHMVASGRADFAISNDYDTLFCGSPNLIVDFDKPAAMCVLDLLEVRDALKLTSQVQLVDFAILCGCDVTHKPPGVGPVRAIALLKEHGTVERVLAALAARKPRGRPVTAGRGRAAVAADFSAIDVELAHSHFLSSRVVVPVVPLKRPRVCCDGAAED